MRRAAMRGVFCAENSLSASQNVRKTSKNAGKRRGNPQFFPSKTKKMRGISVLCAIMPHPLFPGFCTKLYMPGSAGQVGNVEKQGLFSL